MRPGKPARTVRKARALRRTMSLPETMLWRHLRGSPQGVRFRRQHPAGKYVLDFFCAKANLAIEIDGVVHAMGDQPARDVARDAWLNDHRIDTVRIAAQQVLEDPVSAAHSIVAHAQSRIIAFRKTPPSAAKAAATSPSQDDGEDQGMTP